MKDMVAVPCSRARPKARWQDVAAVCYPPSSRPPLPPDDLIRTISGGAGGHDEILTSEDGARFRAYVATAAEGEQGIVICPDVRGLIPFYEELAERFAS